MAQNNAELNETEILDLFGKGNVSTIVLSGKSGTGKTWMARKVARQAVKQKKFDFTLWISLSVRYDKMSLYEHIARQFSLISCSMEMDNDVIQAVEDNVGKKETLDDLKKKIHARLSSDDGLQNILVILDDEGNKMKEGDTDLKEVLEFIMKNSYKQSAMIANGDGQQKRKLLITSVDEGDRHKTEGDKKVVKMVDLTPEMSISLLKQGAGAKVFDISDEVEMLVKDFIKTKKIFTPGEVALLAKLLSYHQYDSKVQDVEHALKEAYGVDNYIYAQLLSSRYGKLSDGVLVDFSWQGSHLFRDHGSIHYGELISYWILEGYLGPVNSLEKVYEEGHRVLMQLMDCQMLKEVNDNFVHMVRGIANIIDYHRHGYGGTANLGLANVLVDSNDWHGLGEVTKMDGTIRTVGNYGKEQQLMTLLLDVNCLSREDPNHLLQTNQGLQILGLFGLRIPSLPQSFSLLKKLNVLVLRDCDFLEKIDDIAELITLTVLEVSGSCLVKSIPENFFQRLTQLRSLHFSDLQIEVLPKTFYDLTELRWLILKGCSHLTKLQSLRNCGKLMAVDLSGAASLTTFPEKNLKSLPKLQTLNLSKTMIKSVPILHETGELTHLLVSGCLNMERLPSLRSLTNLQVLDVSSSAIKEFHDKSLQNNSSLKILDLSKTAFPSEALPYSIGKPREFYLKGCSEIQYVRCAESPKDLEILDFSGACNLVKIEGKFFECLETLRVLNLSETKVKDLPSLSSLNNLRRLLLSCCVNLEKLPSLTSSMKLEELDLSDCKALTTIEDEHFSHLPRLRRLVLSKTKIERLPELNSLSNLEELNLSGVKSLREVDFIKHMVKIQDLNLSDTLLKQLPSLSNLKSLKCLLLRGCRELEAIPCLDELHKLGTLDLSQTALSNLPFMGNLSNLHTLLLGGCSNLKDFENNKMIDMSGFENLPCGISGLTQLQHLSLPSVKKNIQAADSDKVISCHQKPSASHWSFFIVDGMVSNTRRSFMSCDSSLFLEFLQSNPSLLTSNHFHLSIHLDKLQNEGGLLFQKDELFFRDVYFLFRHFSKSRGKLMEILGLDTFPNGTEAVLASVEYVFLFDNLFLKSLSDLGDGNIRMLKGCWIERCENMEFVIKMNDSVDSCKLGIPLEILWISNASSLRRIYSENLQSGGFQNLKCLYLDCCPQLSVVVFSSTLLQKLEILDVRFCENLEALFGSDEGEHKLPNLRTLRLWELPELKSIRCTMPSLQLLEVGECPRLGHVLSSSHVPEKLEVLKVRNCCELDNLLEESTSDNCKLPLLRKVHLWGLPKLIRIGIESPLLRSLEVGDCSLLLHVISLSSVPENLGILKIRFCDNLETLFVGVTSENCMLPRLDTLLLWGLPKLVSIGAALQFKPIIRDCPKLNIPVS